VEDFDACSYDLNAVVVVEIPGAAPRLSGINSVGSTYLEGGDSDSDEEDASQQASEPKIGSVDFRGPKTSDRAVTGSHPRGWREAHPEHPSKRC
jgi:hypothetical protein